jgi:hypothetical protein
MLAGDLAGAFEVVVRVIDGGAVIQPGDDAEQHEGDEQRRREQYSQQTNGTGVDR